MRRSLILSLFILSAGVCCRADNYMRTLARIVSNSPAVASAASLTDAEKAENNTGLNLADPEIGLSYQWGVPSDVPDKKTIDVTQEFDFATLSGAKRRLARAKDSAADIALAAARRDIAAEADAIMTEIVFRRRMGLHYDSALSLMRRTLDAAEAAVRKGEMTIIDVNTVKMELNSLETESRLNEIEIRGAMAGLTRLAGGDVPDWNGTDYPDYSLPADFDGWCAMVAPTVPEVMAARAGVSIADTEISLRKSENLPTFSLGYTSELVTDANYHGVTLGFGLPLWANSGRVRAAKAARAAAALGAENAVLDFTLSHRTLFDKAVALRRLDDEARRLRDECDIRQSIRDLYDSGSLSVHDYLSQLRPLLDLDKKVIEAEYDYQKALADFRAATFN